MSRRDQQHKPVYLSPLDPLQLLSDNLVMPTLKAALDDEAIANVLTFVRNSWGHAAGVVTTETVARVRVTSATREEPWNDADLAELSQTMGGSRRNRSGPPRKAL